MGSLYAYVVGGRSTATGKRARLSVYRITLYSTYQQNFGKPPNPEAIGAKVIVYAGGIEQTRSIMPTRSYLTQVELPLTFGLGTASSVNRLEVFWPNGVKDVYKDLTINQNHIFLQR